MKLKQTVSLAILAAMLASGLASCANKKGNDVPTGTDTEPSFVYHPDTSNMGNTVTPTTDKPWDLSYTPVVDTVYLTKADKLTDANGQSVSPVVLQEALNRTGTSGVWSRISYSGADYYVRTASLTTDDIGETGFTPCNKTMYVSVGSANIRKYPSTDNSFSTTLDGGRKLNDAVTVISQSAAWCKIQWTDNGSTKYGYMHISCLSDSKESPDDKEWLDKFTQMSATTMYTTGDSTNIRLKPYTGDKGPLADPNGLPKGTAVTVVGKGTVDGREWYAVVYNYNFKPTQCYISADMLSATPDGSAASLDDIVKGYQLEKLATPVTRYVTDDKSHSQAMVYSRPSRAAEVKNGVTNRIYAIDFLNPKTAVTVYATGKVEGNAPNGEKETLVWAVIKYEGQRHEGYSFISYSVLTTDPSGQLVQTVATLDELCTMYDFKKVTQRQVKVTSASGIKCWTSPTADTSGDIPADATVTVYAEGTTSTGFVSTKWYIVEYSGSLWFVLADSIGG